MTEVNAYRLHKKSPASAWRSMVFCLEALLNCVGYSYYMLYDDETTPPTRRQWILFGFASLYFVRTCFMATRLLPRVVSNEELTVVMLFFIPSILACHIWWLPEESVQMTTFEETIVVATYLLGSYLNSASEYQRKVWKDRQLATKSAKRCYTEGLFSHSRNINYFGENLLFVAWAAASGNVRNFWAPAFMALAFWFYFIPEKEGYLAQRYGAEWTKYKQQTPVAFVPFLA